MWGAGGPSALSAWHFGFFGGYFLGVLIHLARALTGKMLEYGFEGNIRLDMSLGPALASHLDQLTGLSAFACRTHPSLVIPPLPFRNSFPNLSNS